MKIVRAVWGSAPVAYTVAAARSKKAHTPSTMLTSRWRTLTTHVSVARHSVETSPKT